MFLETFTATLGIAAAFVVIFALFGASTIVLDRWAK